MLFVIQSNCRKKMYHMEYFNTKRFLFLVPAKECYAEFDKIDKFLSLLNESGIGEIIEKEKSNKGRYGYNPYNLVATIFYCFSQFRGTLREIHQLCIFDLRVMYLMDQEIPSHNAIKECINKYILPYQYEIFTMITKKNTEKFNLDLSDQYLDGTKMEANANKYKFVHKPTTYHKKLDKKIKYLLVNDMNIEISNNNGLIKSNTFEQIINDYIIKENIDINNIPSGKGKRLTKIQKNYKKAKEYLSKLLEYEYKEKICGENRNSYYKTDIDATAMIFKKDYYSKNSKSFKAGYNFQSLVSSGLIMMYGVFQDRNDYYTFIPIIKLYKKYYKHYPKNLCTDAGYGIKDNYEFMFENNINNYVKFQSWEGEASGKNPQLFYAFDDGVMCLNTCIGEIIPFDNKHKQRRKNTKLYKFIGCDNCNYTYICKKRLKNKNENFRLVELDINYELYKENARKNLLSSKGVEIRVNRSIQVEGTFGQIKQNMQYDRIRRRGIEKVKCELMLMCLGVNFRKLFSMLDNENNKSLYWENKDLKTEKFPAVKQKSKKGT